jgi:hypothetical protein
VQDFSECAFQSQLRRAAAFMKEARLVQQNSGLSLAGPSKLTAQQKAAIDKAANSSFLVTAVKSSLAVDRPLSIMFERFEEMCRRREMAIDHHLRPVIFDLLILEFCANARQFEAVPRHLVAVTVYHGSIATLAEEEEFAALCDAPGVFRHAAVHYPSDPRRFLRRVQKHAAALAEEEEFAALRDTPGVFRHASVNYPSDPRRFLRRVKKHITMLAKDKEFAPLRGTPGIFTQAAVGYPSDPRRFLRQVQKEVAALAKDKEFASLRETPGIFRIAAVSYSTNPRRFLRQVQKEVAALAKDKEFASLRDTPGIFMQAAVGYPSDPRRFLRRMLSKTPASRASDDAYLASAISELSKPP